MKIEIIENNSPIRIFHHPKEVCHNTQKNIIEIRSSQTHEIEEIFEFVNKETKWHEHQDYSELLIIFYVKEISVIQKTDPLGIEENWRGF